MHKVWYYNNCTVRNNENICNNSGGAQEKEKTGWNSVYYQIWWFHPPLNANVLFYTFFLNLTLCMAKLRVLVLCFFYLQITLIFHYVSKLFVKFLVYITPFIWIYFANQFTSRITIFPFTPCVSHAHWAVSNWTLPTWHSPMDVVWWIYIHKHNAYALISTNNQKYYHAQL